MSTDYAEKERDFLASLESDTGRSLAAWMRAIADKRFSDKNETIDWLRQQGFMFSKASWLERIHANGGRPIYAGQPNFAAGIARHEPRPALQVGTGLQGGTGLRSIHSASGAAPAAASQQQPTRPAVRDELGPEPPLVRPLPDLVITAELDELLVKAKALQPLARHVLREIDKAVPGTNFVTQGQAVSIRAPGEYALLAIGAKELKLGLALGGLLVEPPFVAAKPPAGLGTASGISHIAALSDARQVNAALLEAVVKASQMAKS